MMFFNSHNIMTRIVIPNNISLITNNISEAFMSMDNLMIAEFNHPNIINMYATY